MAKKVSPKYGLFDVCQHKNSTKSVVKTEVEWQRTSTKCRNETACNVKLAGGWVSSVWVGSRTHLCPPGTGDCRGDLVYNGYKARGACHH